MLQEEVLKVILAVILVRSHESHSKTVLLLGPPREQTILSLTLASGPSALLPAPMLKLIPALALSSHFCFAGPLVLAVLALK